MKYWLQVRILVAPDKFKGSLSAAQAAEAIQEGWREAIPEAVFETAPLADGGEGTTDIFSTWKGARVRHLACQDALGRKMDAHYVWIPDESLVVMEMSAASGLSQIPEMDRDILCASTFGTGQMIRDALDLAPTTIAVGLGGSATNDGGAGLAAALGWVFLDKRANSLFPTPGNLCEIAEIRPPEKRIFTGITALCDVKNPLLGERGCSRIYGPQKGATEDDIKILETNLRHFADLCERTFGKTHRDTPGAGAAGGSGFGLLTFCEAKIVPGFDWIAGRLHLEERLAGCDLVITGEGSLDSQTLEGKGPEALARLARKHGKPCLAFAGQVKDGAGKIFSKCIPIADPAIGLAENLSRGAQLLRAASKKAALSYLS